MKRGALYVAAIVSALFFSGCVASVDEIGQKQGVSTSTSTQASTSTSSSASTQSTLTSATKNSTANPRKSTTANMSATPAADFPIIDEDPYLIRPSAIAKAGRFIYTQSQIGAKRYLLKIDTTTRTYTELTDCSVGSFALVNESVYYTATNSSTGHSALYVLNEKNTRMLTDKNIGLFWVYKNKL